MAKFLVRGKGKFLEGKLTETKKADIHGYTHTKIEPTEVGVEADSLLHFGTENIIGHIYNAWDWGNLYKGILAKADESGADYVFLSDLKRDVFDNPANYEATLTMYLKRLVSNKSSLKWSPFWLSF